MHSHQYTHRSYLVAQLEVDNDDGHLHACDKQDHKDQAQEAKHVIILSFPDRLKNKKQFNENDCKRQQSAHRNTKRQSMVDPRGTLAHVIKPHNANILPQKNDWEKSTYVKRGRRYQTGSGIWRGIWLVRPGCSITVLRCPK